MHRMHAITHTHPYTHTHCKQSKQQVRSPRRPHAAPPSAPSRGSSLEQRSSTERQLHRLRTHGLHPVSQDALSRLYTPPVERRAHQHMAAQTSSPSHALHSSPLDTPASTRARRLDDGQRPPPHHAQRLRPTLTPHAQQQRAPRRPTETLQCMASARPRSHPARADTAPTLTHATSDRPTRARARRRSSGVCARPAPHSPAPKEHGTPMPCFGHRLFIPQEATCDWKRPPTVFYHDPFEQ